jgi:hypothetical protein
MYSRILSRPEPGGKYAEWDFDGEMMYVQLNLSSSVSRS